MNALDKTVIKNEPRQKAGLLYAQRDGSNATSGRTTRFLCRNVMNNGADRVKGHSRLRHIYDNCRMALLTCPTAAGP
ncbi:hypothetical protein GCM10010321_82630 [Streptomyces chartreusis]|nr:hypothetical protein GCM10010321_82630 [Streptomyces chartreusis]